MGRHFIQSTLVSKTNLVNFFFFWSLLSKFIVVVSSHHLESLTMSQCAIEDLR
jgi:hypothetical protein